MGKLQRMLEESVDKDSHLQFLHVELVCEVGGKCF